MRFLRFAVALSTCLVVLQPKGVAQTFSGFATGGASFSQVDGDDLAGYNRAGVFAGVGVWLDLSDRWRSSLTIGFDQAGSSSTAREAQRGLSNFDKIGLNYVSVPVALHYMDWLSSDELYYHLEFIGGLTYRRLINVEVLDVAGNDVTDNFTYRDNMLAGHVGMLYAWSLKWGAGIVHTLSFTDAQADERERNQFTKQLSLRLRYAF